MANIFDYLKKYRDISFFDKEFNEIDAAICSLIPYIDFKDIILEDNDKKSLGECLISFLMVYKRRGFLKKGFNQSNLVKLAKNLQSSIRYRDIVVYGNVNKSDDKTRFNAITMILPTGDKIITFKGTGVSLVGWKEDFSFAYEFPNICQKEAIKYVNSHISFFDKNVILLGHSKGGHLALVAGMYCSFIKRNKIKQIYSFDGPGLRNKEFNSRKYEIVKNKFIHIVPSYSVIGLLLVHNENYQVVKANKDLDSHSIFTWKLEDSCFSRTKLSSLSKDLNQSIIFWLNSHDDETKEKIVNDIFDYLKENNIDNIIDLKKIKNLLMLFRRRKELDSETREVLNNFIKFNYEYKKISSKEIELV